MRRRNETALSRAAVSGVCQRERAERERHPSSWIPGAITIGSSSHGTRSRVARGPPEKTRKRKDYRGKKERGTKRAPEEARARRRDVIRLLDMATLAYVGRSTHSLCFLVHCVGRKRERERETAMSASPFSRLSSAPRTRSRGRSPPPQLTGQQEKQHIQR